MENKNVWVVVHEIDREPKAVFTNFESADEWATEVYGEQYTKYFEITIEQFTLQD